MELDNSNESRVERVHAPSVSRDKWHSHAISKLARGYLLIVGRERRSANFYQPGKGYEMCAYKTAMDLIREGAVVEAGNHYLGTLYRLAETVTPPPPVKKRVEPSTALLDDDLDDDLGDGIEDELEESLDDDLDEEDDEEAEGEIDEDL